MRAGQWLAVLVTMGLNALDGFDVLSISFASPGIAKDWGIDKATLGWVLSMELLGMALGSLLLGGVADKAGRRPTILACLVAMAVACLGQVTRTQVSELLAWRLLTGSASAVRWPRSMPPPRKFPIDTGAAQPSR